MLHSSGERGIGTPNEQGGATVFSLTIDKGAGGDAGIGVLDRVGHGIRSICASFCAPSPSPSPSPSPPHPSSSSRIMLPRSPHRSSNASGLFILHTSKSRFCWSTSDGDDSAGTLVNVWSMVTGLPALKPLVVGICNGVGSCLVSWPHVHVCPSISWLRCL